MKCQFTVLLALGVVAALVAAPQAFAQGATRTAYRNQGVSPAARPNVGAQPRFNGEPLPAARSPHNSQGRTISADPFIEDAPQTGGGHHMLTGCEDGSCNDSYFHDAPSYSSNWFSSRPAGQFFFTADYLYVRASFSEALSYATRDDSLQNLVTIDYHQLEFDYESSYRFGGGYRLCGCGDEVRFLFTRLNSSASDIAPADALVPVEPGQQVSRTLVDADVDIKTYDLECAKTIPLFSKGCCGCGDTCGDCCNDCCAPCCPVWDITWSGGIRVADASWRHSHSSVGISSVNPNQIVGDSTTSMDFDGVGAKFSLEGRRYFFASGWLSTYLRGDISLLWGEIELQTVHTTTPLTGPDFVTVANFKNRQIVPVTEIEAGLSAQVTCNSRFSTGYMLSAWHDLGFRDEFPATGLDPAFPIRYDDANILGFDGWFARLEVAY